MDTTRELQMPCGCEVGASLHPNVHEHVGTSLTLSERSGMRGKLDTLKSRGLSKVHTAQSSLRDGTKSQVTKMNDSMKNKPMLWAGVAAASGFGLGLIGRIAHWRSRQRRITPDLIIIETGC
ncbi:MAG TPA: hypothetical protein VNI54_02050 [Thermoanaerobaculia bacterium]|nr:hypothetical protein [Thermoanaerobaculia bacterium]